MNFSVDFDYINQKLKSGLKLRFDIGLSNNMPNSLEWLQRYNDIFVISLEPHPNNFISCKNILDNTEFKDRCYLIEAAIDNVELPVKKVFYGLNGPETNYDAGTSSLNKPIGRFKDSIDEVYNVDVISLKYILDNIDYDFIDLLKTDTQGNDLNVLKSLGDHIKNIIEIYAEYDESEDYQNANTGEELDNFLTSNDFEKSEIIRQPARNNKVEDCRYRNSLYISYSYINDSNILITLGTENQNPYTWRDKKVVEITLVEKFASKIKNDFTILDIGSQSGCFSLAAKFYPNTKWYSFEPDWWNRNLLLSNLKLNHINNVFVYEDALSNELGETVLNICHWHRGLNTLGKNLKRFNKEESFEFPVKVNTIDNLFLNNKIDLIKIDTEGSEYNIILGGIETIKKYKPKILLEYCEENLLQCGYSFKDLNNLINDINYEITWISETGSDIFIESKPS